jgi:hypothetical protein
MSAMFVDGLERNLYSEPLMDAFYQVSVHLVMRFQRKRFFTLTNQKKELPMAAMFVY